MTTLEDVSDLYSQERFDILMETTATGQVEAIAELPIDNTAQALAIYNLAKRLEKAAKVMMNSVKTFAQTSPDPIENEEGQIYVFVEATAIYPIGTSRMTPAQYEAAEKLGLLDVRDASSWRFMKAKKGE